MTQRLPFVVVQAAAGIWLLSTPLLWLGAALSKMDTIQRYNIQLAVMTAVCALAVISAIGAFKGRKWSRLVLILLSWAATVFWLDAAYAFYTTQLDKPNLEGLHKIPLVIGICYVAMALALHLSERQPSDDFRPDSA